MGGSAMLKLLCVGLMGLLVLGPHAVEAAISCSTVYSDLSPCLSYIEAGTLSPACCPGIKGLLGRASTKPDRQSICGCLKNLANSYRSAVPKAQQLIVKICRVSLFFRIDPNEDCSRVN